MKLGSHTSILVNENVTNQSKLVHNNSKSQIVRVCADSLSLHQRTLMYFEHCHAKFHMNESIKHRNFTMHIEANDKHSRSPNHALCQMKLTCGPLINHTNPIIKNRQINNTTPKTGTHLKVFLSHPKNGGKIDNNTKMNSHIIIQSLITQIM